MKTLNRLSVGAIAVTAIATLTMGTIHPLPTVAQPDHPTSTPDTRRQQHIHDLRGHQNDVTFLQFSAAGQRLISHSPGEPVRLWDLAQGKLLRVVQQTAAAGLVAATSDAQTLAVVNRQGSVNHQKIQVWNLNNDQLRFTLSGHSQPITHLAISQAGQTLISSSQDKILVWNLQTGKRLQTIRPNLTIHAIALSPDGQILASGGADKDQRSRLKLWSVKTGKLLRSLKGNGEQIRSLHINSDKSLISVADTIQIWNLRTQQPMSTLPYLANTLAISEDGQKFVTIAWDNSVKLWDIQSGKLEQTLFQPSVGDHTLGRIYLSSVALSPDGTAIAIGSGGGLSSFGINVYRTGFSTSLQDLAKVRQKMKLRLGI